MSRKSAIATSIGVGMALFLTAACAKAPVTAMPSPALPPASPTSAAAQSEATVRAYIAAAESKDVDRYLALFANDAVYYDYAYFDTREYGAKPVKELRPYFEDIFGDPYERLKFDRYILSADGTSAALVGAYTGFTDAGTTATVPMAEILQLRDGKIIRLDDYYDDIGFN